jgi:L-alanine-DL-glutamate epimerase-like enolase superfamily enzyme
VEDAKMTNSMAVAQDERFRAAIALARSVRTKVTDVRLLSLKTAAEVGSLEPAWDPGRQMTFRIGGGKYLEIHTDQGLVGIGPAIDGKLLPCVAEQLVGNDPFDIEQHAARLRYYAGGRSRRGSAGVDVALWDLIGKAAGLPLYRLWGADKEKVRVYASTIQLSTADKAPQLATALLEEGWTAIKLRLHHSTLEEDIRTVEAVRAAISDRMEIMVDANQAQSSGDWQPGVQWDFNRAVLTARELERLRCAWLEEPLSRYSFDLLARLSDLVDLPIAGGENNCGLHEFKWMLELGAYDILQPDCLVSDGITGVRKIAALAQTFNRVIVPHHGGGAIGTIAHLHLVASLPHAPYLELLHDPPIGSYRHRFAVFKNPPVVDRTGCMSVPQAPGLGVEIDPDLVARP